MPDPLRLSVSIADLQAALDPGERAAVEAGALDPREVWYEFVTLEDDRVRPSHRALHGTVWKVGDPNAPVPPLDYGCRCSLRYVAPPGSVAARKGLLPPSPQPTTDTVPAVYAAFLRDRLPAGFDLPRAVREAAALPVAEQVPTLAEALQRAVATLTAGQARDLARMAMQARREGRILPGKPGERLLPAPLGGP